MISKLFQKRILYGLLLLQITLLVVLPSQHLEAQSQIDIIMINVGSEYRGSSPTTVRVGVNAKGVNAEVDITIPGSDAYYAIVALIAGVYDTVIGKYRAIGYGYSTVSKSYCGGLGCWERINIDPIHRVLDEGKVDVCYSTSSMMWIRYKAYTHVNVVRCTWWGLSCSTEVERKLVAAEVNGLIPCRLLI